MVREKIRPVFHENVVFLADWLLPLHEGDRPRTVRVFTKGRMFNTEWISTSRQSVQPDRAVIQPCLVIL